MKDPLKNNILWPAMGCPAQIDCRTFPAYLSLAPQDVPSLEEIDGHLVNLSSGTSISLTCGQSRVLKASQVNYPGKLSSWVADKASEVLEVNFILPCEFPLASTRTELFDLEIRYQGKRLVKRNAVFSPAERFPRKVMVATDIHVATRWDEIEKEVAALFRSSRPQDAAAISELVSFDVCQLFSRECFDGSWVNPNRNFAALIRRANRALDEGRVDALVLLGDLVDYKFKAPRKDSGGGFQDTEWSLFESLVMGRLPYCDRLRVPMYTTTGNHDYRLYPYSLQVYGLKHCGISDIFTEEYLKRKGIRRRVKYRLRDLDAIRISRGKRHSLEFYYERINPFDNYAITVGETRWVFSDTGPDVFCNFRHLLSRRPIRFLSAIAKSIEAPNSDGLKRSQVEWINNEVEYCGREGLSGLLLFAHAPFFDTAPEYGELAQGGAEIFTGLSVGGFSSASVMHPQAAEKFESLVSAAKLDYCAFYRNHLPVLVRFKEAAYPVAVLSGHGHRVAEFAVDKRTGKIFNHLYSARGDLSELLKRRVLLMEGASLGHVERNYQEQVDPAFREMTFQEGSLIEIKSEALEVPPLNGVRSYLRFRNDGQYETVTIIFSTPEEATSSAGPLIHKVVVMATDYAESKRFGDLLLKPHNDDQRRVLADATSPSVVNNANHEVFVIEHACQFRIEIRGRPDDLRLSFIVSTYEDLGGKYHLKSLVLHHQELK